MTVKKNTMPATTDNVKLTPIIARSADELRAAAQIDEVFPLSDLPQLKAATMRYVANCQESGTLPTMSGLARSLGRTRESLYRYSGRHPDSPTAEWLKLYSDFCGDALAEAALHGHVQPVFAIFVEKARYGWRDAVTIETAPPDPLGPTLPPEELRQRLDAYLDLDALDPVESDDPGSDAD